jgi:hypothetical protein
VKKERIDEQEKTDQLVRLTFALVKLVFLIHNRVFELDREIRELKKLTKRDGQHKV